MKFGTHTLPTYMAEAHGTLADFYRAIFEQVIEVEKLGFDQAWVTEHHFGGYGGTLPHPPTFLAAAAQVTSRIRLGVAVAVLPLHNPIDLAEAYAMADVISGGRIDFGIGKGSEPVEYRKLGTNQDETTQRFLESAEVMRQAWSDRPVDFRGEFYWYENVNVLPKPIQRPHPRIWVGATRNEETFRWAGEMGYDLMTVPFVHPSTEALRQLVKIYRDALARSGHDFVGREVLGKFHIYVSDGFERGLREAAPFMKNYSDLHHAVDPARRLTERDIGADMARGFIIVGDPERCTDTILRWHEEAGITAFSGTFHFGGMPQELALKNIRLFAERVMPKLKDS
ncbi:MAG TPA: LLM class flavin-dependent oxidoreductase [Candidatus Binatia bacterium]|jgi:alkanesulfonate monooxygenase SsuD/methylene tetrahydromethanopterin reductase-like flavin-dependent oxidoreductase (luciferase family)